MIIHTPRAETPGIGAIVYFSSMYVSKAAELSRLGLPSLGRANWGDPKVPVSLVLY